MKQTQERVIQERERQLVQKENEKRIREKERQKEKGMYPRNDSILL